MHHLVIFYLAQLNHHDSADNIKNLCVCGNFGIKSANHLTKLEYLEYTSEEDSGEYFMDLKGLSTSVQLMELYMS